MNLEHHYTYQPSAAGRTLHSRQFGCKPGISTRTQMTAGLNSMFAACASDLATAILDADDYEINGPLSWPNGNPRIVGAGSGVTRILSAETDYDGAPILEVGSGLAGFGGLVRGLSVHGPAIAAPPQDGSIGIGVNAVRWCGLVDLVVSNVDIAYDSYGNCYGMHMNTCIANASLNNVGLHVRTASENGDDRTYDNCWLGGAIAPLQISGGSTGHRFKGGQIAVASFGEVPSPLADGAVVLGKDYLTGVEDTDGLGRLYFGGTDFENSRVGSIIKAYQNVQACVFQGATFLGQDSQTDAPPYILHTLTRRRGNYHFLQCNLGRHFSGETLFLCEGTGGDADDGRFTINEWGWNNIEALTFDGGNRTVPVGTFTTMVMDAMLAGKTPSALGFGDFRNLSIWGDYKRRFWDIAGAGVPTMAAYTGSLFHRSDGPSGEQLYIQRNAGWVNTGWTAIG